MMLIEQGSSDYSGKVLCTVYCVLQVGCKYSTFLHYSTAAPEENQTNEKRH